MTARYDTAPIGQGATFSTSQACDAAEYFNNGDRFFAQVIGHGNACRVLLYPLTYGRGPMVPRWEAIEADAE